jgi:hypothetical protein
LSEEDFRRLSPDWDVWNQASQFDLGDTEFAGAADGLVWCYFGPSAYRVAFSVVDEFKSSCSCPSRKKPCKHVIGLGLLWVRGLIVDGDIPDFVRGWARKSTTTAKRVQSKTPKDPVKAEAAAAVRLAESNALVLGGLGLLEGELLRFVGGGIVGGSGVGELVSLVRGRLVDAKASALVGRLGGWVGRLVGGKEVVRRRVWVEVSGLLVLCAAFRADPGDAAVRRAVVRAESPVGEGVRGDFRVVGSWVVRLGGGLVERSVGYVNVLDGGLFRVVEVSKEGVGSGLLVGDDVVFRGCLLPYAGGHAERAVWVGVPDRLSVGDDVWPAAAVDPFVRWWEAVGLEPWVLDRLLQLPSGYVVEGVDGGWFFVGDAGDVFVPLVGRPWERVVGVRWVTGFVLWDGFVGVVLRVVTEFGVVCGE